MKKQKLFRKSFCSVICADDPNLKEEVSRSKSIMVPNIAST
jgi:hypothetical protein